MRQVNWIVLHCTAGPQNQTPQQLLNFWQRPKLKGGLGWRNPGYHRLVLADGSVHQYAPYSAITNGVANHNRDSIHISYTGGVGPNGQVLDNRTEAQRNTLRQLVIEANRLFPNANIRGHRDFSPDRNRNGIIEPHEWIKSCPSFSVRDWLREINFKSVAEKPIMRTTARVNIREGAGTQFRTVAPVLPQNIEVQVINFGNGWNFVQVLGASTIGWVSASFLA